MLITLLFASLLYSASAKCPDYFTLIRNGECFTQVDRANDYNAASEANGVKSKCAAFNAIPVIIRNQDDNDFWMNVGRRDRNTYNGDNRYGNIILGIECSADYPYYKWIDGSDIFFVPEGTDPTINNQCEQHGDYCMWTVNPVDGSWTKVCNTYSYVDIYCVIPHSPNTYPLDDDCAGFEHDEDDDVCYQVGRIPTDWNEANTVCRSFGGIVASVHNDMENNFVRRLAISKGLVNGLMLGGINSTVEGFRWNDGSKWDYDNFAPLFPVDGLGNCVAMETNNINGPWINVECSTLLPFVCKRQLDVSPPQCNGELRNPGELIFSPGFPMNASIPCDFLLKVDPGFLVEVEIVFLEANSCCDRLILTEGTLGGDAIAVLTGDWNNGRKFRTTSQNIMRASWQPKGGVNVLGMMIIFNAVPK